MNTDNKAARVGRLVGRVAGFLPAAHYAAVGGVGAVVALVPEASAGPIQSTAANVLIPVTTTGVYINVVTGVTDPVPASVPGWDLNPWSSTTLNWFNPSTPVGGAYMRYPGVLAGTPVGNLDLGTVVDAGGSFGATTSNVGGSPGQWVLNGTNYFGFRFIGEDAQLHYGWGTVILGASLNGSDRMIGELWYESDPDTGITVTASVPGGPGVPEPSTALLLASGVAGLLALRRRRRQAR